LSTAWSGMDLIERIRSAKSLGREMIA